MSEAVPESPIKSPCISLCQMDAASGLCKGCFRTIDEIVAWGQSSNAYKRAVWAQLEQRKLEQSA